MRKTAIAINVLALLAALVVSAVTSTLGTLETQMKFTDMDRAEGFNHPKLDAHLLARHGSVLDIRGPEFAAWITAPARGPLQAVLVTLIVLSLANIAMAWAGMGMRVGSSGLATEPTEPTEKRPPSAGSEGSVANRKPAN